MSEKSTIAGLISKAAKKLRDDFEHIRETISHSGEKGGETEDKVREFLNGHMPKRFHATKGFVIDADNQMSDHQDVIIYDEQSSPVYKYDGANQIVSADAVAAIMEVKAVLNKSQLEEAFAKIEEVKRLKKRPISEMDQKATASTLTTTGTLGIILGFGSDISLGKLAEHCVELNEKYETAYRPDIIVVLDVGVINYSAQFVGARNMGDIAVATDDEFVIPPCYVHLVAREDGAFSLNRLFTHLLSHLALYPRRPSIPPFSVLLEGTSSIVHSLGVYQYNTERRLVRYETPPAKLSERNPIIRIRHKTSKEELAALTYIPWQDGGVIRKKGKIPLIALLVWFTKGGPPHTMQVEDAELSTVMKVTRPEFQKWPATIERQSDMTATLEIPPPFEVRETGMEGTAEPFIARVFLGLIEMAASIFSPQDKNTFDQRFTGTLNPALELRRALVSVGELVSGHKEALQKGTIVRKAQVDPLLSERIDNPLRSHTVHFLEMADAIIKNLPSAMKFFVINIDHMADREQRFAKDCERNEAKHPELVAYLRKLRPSLLDIDEQFRKMRVEGWNLSNVKYTFSNGVVSMVEPLIEGKPVSEYVARVFSILALAIEEVIMYGFQRSLMGPIAIVETPLEQRNPINAQRFRRTLRGTEVAWQLKWTGKGFYDS
ncbi:MAG TPA: DUF6602 domain-containing protein [Terriglobales bacterium]|nr:DUF6602 domain-containing protein [Terriglobales bacterium]